MIGAKMTTTGVLFRKADKNDMAGRRRAFVLVILAFFLGKRLIINCSNMPLLRTPSLTRKSIATVIMPLLEKPSRHSFGVSIPAQSIITTHENRISPGLSLSAINAHIINMRQSATNITSKFMFLFFIL
jgi:hypothetical protein